MRLLLALIFAVSCCKTIRKPEPIARVESHLIEQTSFGTCRISFSPDALGTDGTLVELTVSNVYYGIFLISYNDYITIPCSTGDTATFNINRMDGTFLRQRNEAIPPPQV